MGGAAAPMAQNEDRWRHLLDLGQVAAHQDAFHGREGKAAEHRGPDAKCAAPPVDPVRLAHDAAQRADIRAA